MSAKCHKQTFNRRIKPWGHENDAPRPPAFPQATALMWILHNASLRCTREEEPLIEPADPHQHDAKANEG